MFRKNLVQFDDSVNKRSLEIKKREMVLEKKISNQIEEVTKSMDPKK